jgi:hypothetical protein
MAWCGMEQGSKMLMAAKLVKLPHVHSITCTFYPVEKEYIKKRQIWGGPPRQGFLHWGTINTHHLPEWMLWEFS